MPIPVGFRETIITPKASRSVEALWSFTADGAGRSLVLPDGRCDIIILHNSHRNDPPIPVITGPATLAYTVVYEAGDCWRGMRLRPGNGVLLWRDRILDAENALLRGRDAVALLPILAGLNDAGTTLDDLTAVFVNEPSHADQKVSRALDALHASGGRIGIEPLAEWVGCTPRHLNRLFRAHVGLGAKTYAQLIQFHRTLKLIQRENMPITDAAFEGGYADHAHLTRAFRRFGGFAPSALPDDLSLPALFS